MILLLVEELLSEEVRCVPCIFDKADKAYKERDTVKIVSFFSAFVHQFFSLLLRLLKTISSSNFFFRRTLSAMLLLFTIPVKTKAVFVQSSCRYFEILNTMLIVPLSLHENQALGNKQIFLFIIKLNQSESLSLYKREIRRLSLW